MSGIFCNTTHAVIILVRLAMGTLGCDGDAAASEMPGTATAALAALGHGNARDRGTALATTGSVVVDVVDTGTVDVVVESGSVVVAASMADVARAGTDARKDPVTTTLTASAMSGRRRNHVYE